MMIQRKTQPVYDALVVGSGASGGLAGQLLCEKGMKVLMLEAGPPVDPLRDFRSHTWPWELMYRGFGKPGLKDKTQWNQATASEYNSHFYVKDTEHPYVTPPDKPFIWIRSRIVGGKTLHWGRMSYRLSDYDFKAASLDGVGEDWPVSYADLAPYYDKVEEYIGVSGTYENLPQLPDGKFLPPMNLTCGENLLKRGAAKLGIKAIPMRVSMLTKPHNGRPACHYCGHCSLGCDVGAMFNSVAVTLPRAFATGNLTLKTDAIVRHVLMDGNGRAKGVGYVDRLTKEYREVFAKVVVLGAACLESTRIMLNSTSDKWPTGIANSSGVLGHYLMDHTGGAGASGLLPVLMGRASVNEDGKNTGLVIPRFQNLTDKDKNPSFLRGYIFECGAGMGMFPYGARSVPGFGAEFKKQVRRHYTAPVSLELRGQMLPDYNNFVEIDKDRVDAWGIPVLRIACSHSDNDRAQLKHGIETCQEILKAAGAEITSVRTQLAPPGRIIHEVGTCRMGVDPRKSVLNRFNQAHDIPNLFVVDGSAFVTVADKNPTLTIMALTWRAMDYLAEELKAGRV